MMQQSCSDDCSAKRGKLADGSERSASLRRATVLWRISVTIALEAYLKQRRELVETSLQRVLPDGTPALPSDACMYSVLASGKRLRPILGPGQGQDHYVDVLGIQGARARARDCLVAALWQIAQLGQERPNRCMSSRCTSSTATADHDRPRLCQAQRFLRLRFPV